MAQYGTLSLDVMQSILMLVRQVNQGRAEVENQFTRAVDRAGNRAAQALTAEVFELIYQAVPDHKQREPEARNAPRIDAGQIVQRR